LFGTGACASLDIGATALRRWVDQVRKEQKGQPVKGTKAITEDQRQIQELHAKIKQMALEAEILKTASPALRGPLDEKHHGLH
jgi:transposase